MEWHWLMKGYEYTDARLWDADSAMFGYYDYVASDGTAPTNKSFNGTVDAITTHVLQLYLLTGEPKYRARLFSWPILWSTGLQRRPRCKRSGLRKDTTPRGKS